VSTSQRSMNLSVLQIVSSILTIKLDCSSTNEMLFLENAEVIMATNFKYIFGPRIHEPPAHMLCKDDW
jgi:hypothetical protein